MKPWQINLVAIALVVVIAIFTPNVVARDLIFIIVSASAVWAYFDAKKLQINKYKSDSFLAVSDNAASVATVVWLLWIIAFPLYISYRQKIIEGKVPLKDSLIIS